MMPRKLKADWLRALRSGKYKQGEGALERQFPDGRVLNCCLGVLCRIGNVSSRTKERPTLGSNLVAFEGGVGYVSSYDFPTDDVRESFGLSHPLMLELANINDDGWEDFRAIAQVIRVRAEAVPK